jgi:hypothetical protein
MASMLPQQESATGKTLATHNRPIIIEESDSNISLPPLAMHAKEAIGRALRKLLCGLTTKPFKLILFANLCCFQHLLCAWTSSAPQSETTSSTCGVAPETATTG